MEVVQRAVAAADREFATRRQRAAVTYAFARSTASAIGWRGSRAAIAEDSVQIALGRDGTTGQSMLDVVGATAAPALQAINPKVEGKTAALKNPHQPASLAWLAWIVGRLGGWSGYTSRGYKPPGPKTIARGLARLDGLIEGWNIAVHYNVEPSRSADVRLP